jgi:penicillin amidase
VYDRVVRCRPTLLALSLVVGLVAAASGAAVALPPVIVVAQDVLQPGQSGDPSSNHFADQLPLYRSWTFKPMPLDAPASAIVETPRTGVRLARDAWGVPYATAATDADASFGVGWGEAEDRFLEMDVLRHQVEGRLAELLPPSTMSVSERAAVIDGDVANRSSEATDAALLAQFNKRPLIERQMMQAFVNGINGWRSDRILHGGLPIEYLLLGQPAPWRVADSLHVASYIAHNFGLAGGQELRAASILRALRAAFPKSRARANAYFSDLAWVTDPASPTTIPASDQFFTYPAGGTAGIAGAGVAIPDAAPKLAAGVRAPAPGPYTPGIRHLASNAIVISGKLSATGHNLLVGGPQVGQYDPQILVEVAIHGKTVHARGATFPGIGPFVLIGRTASHAWTFTSGADDQSDTWANLVNPKNTTQYRFNGKWERFTTRTEPIAARTPAGGEAVVRTLHLRYAGHGHGLVRATGTVAKAMVAFSTGSTVQGHELDVVGAILALNRETAFAPILKSLPTFPAGFNLLYSDPTRIAYYHLGWYPVRAADADARLPTLGNGQHEWHGRIPFSQMPSVVNPSQGWLANWNNKPVAGWIDGDSTPWGGAQRVQMLQDQLAVAHTMTLTKLRRVIQNAAYLDGRVRPFRALILDSVERSSSLAVQNAADVLASWDGMRGDRDGDGKVDSGAVAILDGWWVHVQQDLLRATVGKAAFDLAGDTTFDREFWGSDRASLLLHVLRGSASSVALRGPWPSGKALQAIVLKAFTETMADLKATYGTADPARWLAPVDHLTYTSFSSLITPPADVPYMNRGTYNQLIELG